jgi:hypothetical protein
MAPVATLSMVSMMPSYTFWAPEGASSKSVCRLEALVGATWRERGRGQGDQCRSTVHMELAMICKCKGRRSCQGGAHPRLFLAEGERQLLTAKAAKQTATKASPL